VPALKRDGPEMSVSRGSRSSTMGFALREGRTEP
jgi:hypothetical protein